MTDTVVLRLYLPYVLQAEFRSLNNLKKIFFKCFYIPVKVCPPCACWGLSSTKIKFHTVLEPTCYWYQKVCWCLFNILYRLRLSFCVEIVVVAVSSKRRTVRLISGLFDQYFHILVQLYIDNAVRNTDCPCSPLEVHYKWLKLILTVYCAFRS